MDKEEVIDLYRKSPFFGRFEEIIDSWNPNTTDSRFKKLPIIKGIVGREEVSGETLVDNCVYDELKYIQMVENYTGYVHFNYSLRNHARMWVFNPRLVGLYRKEKESYQLHRYVMNCLGEEYDHLRVDHINRDNKNNTEANLRFATSAENSMNSCMGIEGVSKYKGVNPTKLKKGRIRWVAIINIKGVQKKVGTFDTEIEAAIAYDEAAREHFKEFAYLNFPKEGEGEERFKQFDLFIG